jgi:hypothetical protein
MAHTSEIDNIPADQADQVVQDFRDAGATNVIKSQQVDGNFSVIATFGDGADRETEHSLIPKTGILAGISTDHDVTQHLTCLQGSAIQFVCRYYSVNTKNNEKRLTSAEAKAISAIGLQIVVVYEDSPTGIGYFSFARGHLDGVNAYHYGNLLHQPKGSAIYFAVDYDAKPQEITGGILDYFRGVKQGFTDGGQGSSIYDIGVYGSGLCCDWLKQHATIAKYTWLAESSGWNESGSYSDWDIKQRIAKKNLCGLTGGVNGNYEENDGKAAGLGAFTVLTP